MLTCRVCGRKFRSKAALGGHMSHAHPKSFPGAAIQGNNEPDSPETELANSVRAETVEGETEDQSKAEEIRDYIAQGYSFEELVHNLQLPERSVRREWAKTFPPESKGQLFLPVIRKQTEVLESEALLRSYSDGSDNDQAELRGMMKLRAAMLMVMELAHIEEKFAAAEAKRLEPILKVLREGREELDAAAARAKSSSFEMAQQAAQSAVGGVVQYLEDREAKAPPPSPPKTMDETMTRRVDWAIGKMTDMMWTMMESRMFPQQAGGNLPEGWEYQGSASRPQPGPQTSQPEQGSPPGWAVEKEANEEKEVQSNG